MHSHAGAWERENRKLVTVDRQLKTVNGFHPPMDDICLEDKGESGDSR